ncbi:MAG TPA: hypothetical protein VE224_05890 [Pseudolabrys sp.]|jgi:hypothetical protein|nr:hypothetical protein [Pseudolabrys sp.]
MSNLTKIFTGVALAAGLALAVPGAAQAQHWHHGGGHHDWHGGGWHHHGWHGGWGPGFALGFGGPYYAAPDYYGGDCGWVRERYWRYGAWYWRRVWRCW